MPSLYLKCVAFTKKTIIIFHILVVASLLVVDAKPKPKKKKPQQNAILNAAPKNESISGQIQRAKSLIAAQQLVDARPLLQSLLANPGVEKRVHPTLEFHIALSYVFEYFDTNQKAALDTALSSFGAFLEKYPKDTLAPMARYNRADLLAVSKNYKEALKDYIPLYRNPESGIDSAEVLQKIILIYIAENKWAAGKPYFEEGIRVADSAEDRTTYAAYLLIANAKQGDVSDPRQYLSFFNSSAPVFYTTRFNASLMEIGDQLRSSGDLATASLFYRFVRSYEDLEVGLSNYVKSLQQEVAKYEGNVVLRNFYQQTKTKLDNAEADLVALKASTNYTPLLNWRIASVYMEMGREWEAYWRFRLMVDEYPDHEFAEEIQFSSFSLGRKLGQRKDSEALAREYLEHDDFTQYRGTLSDDISTDYLESERFEDLYALTDWYLSLDADDPAASLLLFKHGMARLTRFETPELIADFQEFKNKYGRSKSALVINYFLALGHLTEEHHQSALDLFEEVIANPNPRFRADASFRKALCVMGLDRLDEALELLQAFVKRYPDNQLRAQAELVLGNLTYLMADTEAALEHYYLIESYTDDLGLLASGELKIAQILFDEGDEEAAIARLKKFHEANPTEPEIIPTVVTLAGFYDQREEPRIALNTIRGPLDQFFEMTDVDQLDGLLVDYLKKDRALREMRVKTESFFERLDNEPDLLKTLVGNRAKQYRFFKRNSKIDALVKYSFVKDDAFRKEILSYFKKLDDAYAKKVAKFTAENPEAPVPEQAPYPIVTHQVLEDLKAQIRELNKSIPSLSADDWLAGRLAEASGAGNLPLVVRIESALASTEDPVGTPPPELVKLVGNAEVWPKVGLSGKLWILDEYGKSRPDEVIRFLEEARLDFFNTSVELRMHQILAECYQRAGQVRKAITQYEVLIKRFASADAAGEAAMKIGLMEIEEGNYAAARERLESILYHNEWRGQRHGEALLWIGRAYVAEGKYAEAHGFFERIMLGYPGFNELLGTAYYEDILALKKMGEPESAQTVYEAFKMTPGLEDTEAAALIRKEFE